MTDQPVNFDAGQLAFWNDNRHVFRVYVLPRELLLMKLGNGFRDPRSMAGMGGTVGAGITAFLSYRKIQTIAEKMKQYDAASVDELRSLANAGKGSFIATPENTTELSLNPPSAFWGLMLSGTHHAGILRFRHEKRGKFNLELFTRDDAKTAYHELPKAWGDAITVKASWNEGQQRLV